MREILNQFLNLQFGVRYEWSQKVQGSLLAAYFIGVLPASIPAGILSEKFGGAKVVA